MDIFTNLIAAALDVVAIATPVVEAATSYEENLEVIDKQNLGQNFDEYA